MEKCIQCSKELHHVPGRKEKSFCDVNCRNKYFYAKRKKEIEDAKVAFINLPSDYEEVKKIGILTKDGEIKPLKVKKQGSPKNACDVPEQIIQQPEKEAILAQISAIKAEKCPDHRNTSLGRKSWQIEQDKRIQELQNKLP